jgi:hypothetical protein
MDNLAWLPIDVRAQGDEAIDTIVEMNQYSAMAESWLDGLETRRHTLDRDKYYSGSEPAVYHQVIVM